MDCLAAKLFFSSCFSDTVFVTLIRTAVETEISGVHKLLHTGEVPASSVSLFWTVADSLSVFVGLCLHRPERADELPTSHTQSLAEHRRAPNIKCRSGRYFQQSVPPLTITDAADDAERET